MPKVDVFNLSGEGRRARSLGRRVRRRGERAALLRSRQSPASIAASGHRRRQRACCGQWIVEEDLPPEGDRPRAARFDSGADICRRRPGSSPRPRDWSYRPASGANRRSKDALSLLLKEGRLIVLDEFALDEIKTKKVVQVLSTLQVAKKALVSTTAQREAQALDSQSRKPSIFAAGGSMSMTFFVTTIWSSASRRPKPSRRAASSNEDSDASPEIVIRRPSSSPRNRIVSVSRTR